MSPSVSEQLLHRSRYLLALLSVLAMTGSVRAAMPVPWPSNKTDQLLLNQSTSNAVTLTMAGDLMFDRDIRRWMARSGNHYPFAKLGNLLTDSDLVIANLEGPVTHLGTPATPAGPLIFRFDETVLAEVQQAGFQLLSLANNHTDNHGAQGLADTRAALARHNLVSFGDPRLINDKTVWRGTMNHTTVAMIGWNTIEVTDPHDGAVTDLIKQLRTTTDVIVVMPHWGTEYQAQTRSQMQRAHALIDAGADIVVGAHPHVVQGIEEYHGHPIVYSLGNFIFDQTWSEPTQHGLVVRINCRGGRHVSLDLHPVDLHKGQPHPADHAIGQTILQQVAARSDPQLRSSILAGHLDFQP